MSYDALLQEVGEFGYYQQRALIFMTLINMPNGLQTLSSIFMMAVPKFRCSIPGLANDSYDIKSPSHLELAEFWLPRDEESGQFSQCSFYSNVSRDSIPLTGSGDNMTVSVPQANLSTESCSSWVYSTEIFTSTLGMELNLVCGRDFLRTYVNMATVFAIMMGSLICGLLADRFGRKRALMWMVLLHTIFGFSVLLVNSFPVLVVVRFIETALGCALCYCSFTWCLEIVGPSKRALAGLIIMFGWNFGCIVLTLEAYLERDWRRLAIIMAVPSVLLLSFHWILPESPRWLMYKHRTDEAIAVIRNIAEVNRVSSLNEESIKSYIDNIKMGIEKDTASSGQMAQLGVLFKSPRLVIQTIILVINWIVCTMIYYGVALNLGNIVEGSLYLNFFIMTILEVAMVIICVCTLNKVGRKKWYCACIFLSAVSCLSTVVPIVVESQSKWIHSALSNIGRFGVTGAFSTIILFTGELYPTSLRNFGVGFCSFMARLGSIVAPLIGNLHALVGGSLGNALPLVIFGSLALFAGLISLYLPETRGKRLAETIQKKKDKIRSTSEGSPLPLM